MITQDTVIIRPEPFNIPFQFSHNKDGDICEGVAININQSLLYLK